MRNLKYGNQKILDLVNGKKQQQQQQFNFSLSFLPAFVAGKGFVAGASVLGLGALCYYGLGMSSEIGAVEKSYGWPQYVKDRIRDTYGYLGASLVVTAGAAAAAFRSPTIIRLVASNSLLVRLTDFARTRKL